MPFSVRIERIGPDGMPQGSAAVELVSSESEAVMVMRQAMKLGRKLSQVMQYSIYGPGNRLVMTCRSEAADERLDGTGRPADYGTVSAAAAPARR